MYKDGVLTISEWYKGIASSPALGFQSMANLEVFEQPGIAKIAFRTTAPLVTDKLPLALTGIPVAHARDIYGNEYILEGGQGINGKLYKNGTAIESGLGVAWDMAIFSDYLVFTHGGSVSLYGPLSSGGAQLFTGWKTGLNGDYYGKILVRRDQQKFYICNGNTIASISSFSGGVPTVAPTATLDTAATTLPAYQFAVTMVEVKGNIFIGTQAGSGYFDRSSYRVGNVCVWDKSQGGTLSAQVELNENSVHAMRTDGNRVYIVAGSHGNVYVTDTTNYLIIKRIPWATDREFNTAMWSWPNAMSFSHSGNLLVGTSTGSDGFSAVIDNRRHGVYEIVPNSTDHEVVLKHKISTGNMGTSQPIGIGLVDQTAQDTLLIGWSDGNSYGLDITDGYPYSNYGAVIETQLFTVGTRLNRKTFQHIEFSLFKSLVAGQGIRISYRKGLDETYTVIGTWTYATIAAVSNFIDKALITDAEKIQLKIELTQGTTFAQNVGLLYVRLW